MIFRSIQYDLQEAAPLVLISFVLAALFIFLYRYRKEKLQSLADPALLEAIQEPRRKSAFWIKSMFFCLAWMFAVFALMQPKGNGKYPTTGAEETSTSKMEKQTVRRLMHEVIFLVDASASMGVADTHSGKERLTEAKEIAEEVISRLGGQNVSLYAFTSSTAQLVPSTTDYLFARLMLRQLTINEGETEGTDFLQALKSVAKLFFTEPSKKRKTLVLLSDGGDTHLEALQGSRKEQYEQEIGRVLEDAESKKLSVFVVGLGSKKGKDIPGVSYQGHLVTSAVDTPFLRQLSHAGGGRFLSSERLTTLQTADLILESIKSDPQFYDTKVIAPRIQGNQSLLHYDLYYQFPLGMAIFALALALVIPEATRKRRVN